MQQTPTERLRHVYHNMVRSRLIDEQEMELVTRGEAFFHVSSAGHEASAALAGYLTYSDFLHCHYRDKALMLARGMPSGMFLTSVLCRASSHSAGRQMSAHMSDRSRNILSIPGPVGNNALHAVGVAAAIRDQHERPIVLCSVGDGTTQQGEFLEAIAEAVRWRLPVLFLIHDNRWSISVPTAGKTFFSLPDGEASDFYGIPIQRADGWDVLACDDAFSNIVADMRKTRQPAILVMRTERLANHTNADEQRVYRETHELEEAAASRDPISNLARCLQSHGIAAEGLEDDRKAIREEIRAATQRALQSPGPQVCLDASRPLPDRLTDPANEYRGDPDKPELTMRQAINGVLRNHLENDPRIFLYGQDIEDPKGDVFGVTSGLSTLRTAQVVNAPLSESTIVGTAIGRALAGQKPVAFIQFADFLPLAFNQILSELGSMHWRTRGEWQCPVILMITCGGYRPGLGPFHAQTLESVAAHTPGVDVVMPANAADAAGMLNAAFQSHRPTLFFYPKNGLNDRELATSKDLETHHVPIGRARVLRRGNDLTMVGWGNTVGLALEAAGHLEQAGIHSDLIDLRHIAPWDKPCVIDSVRKTGRLLVVHEDNLTCGFGAEVAATVAEEIATPVRIRRVARADTHVPCNFANQLELLPSANRIVEVAAELCGADLTWSHPDAIETDHYRVDAVGSSPADQSITLIRWRVRQGDAVEPGELLAEVEGDKALLELTAPVAGVIVKFLAEEGDSVPVGTPILELATAADSESNKRPAPTTAIPHIRLRKPAPRPMEKPAELTIALGKPCVAKGSRRITSAEIASTFEGTSEEDILSRCGIQERRWAANDEDALMLATRAARAALAQHHLDLSDIDLLVCATGTPLQTTPSMACSLLSKLAENDSPNVQAFDVNAACSGYLYALQTGHDHLTAGGGGKVLVVTTEHLSPLLRKEDFDTAILFGDAATATLLTSEPLDGPHANLNRPILSAQADHDPAIRVPAGNRHGHIEMNGRKVFAKAVRQMEESLQQACTHAGLGIADLDLIVPHQANQRIIDAIQKRLQLPGHRFFSNIRLNGNTSSSSIPLCLDEIFATGTDAKKIGLCAFGGGFTFGAAILDIVDPGRGGMER